MVTTRLKFVMVHSFSYSPPMKLPAALYLLCETLVAGAVLSFSCVHFRSVAAEGSNGNPAPIWEARFDSFGDSMAAPADATVLDRFVAGSDQIALVAGKTDKDVAFKAENHLEGDPSRNSLFYSRTDEAGRTQWGLLLTSGSTWTPAGTWKDWETSEVRDCFEVLRARFSSNGKHILLDLNPHTSMYPLACVFDLETSVLRCFGDGSCSEEIDGTILLKDRKTYLYDENGVSLGARWYDEWITFDGEFIRKGPLRQHSN